MSKYGDLAVEAFEEGFNCAQSVLIAFCDETGMEKGTALRLASSFGGGMGRLREVCGAVTGMFMAAGLLDGYDSPDDPRTKEAHYQLIQDMAGEFAEEFGTIICRELLELPQGADLPTPEARTKEYYEARPCREFVRFAAEILGERIAGNKGEENDQSKTTER